MDKLLRKKLINAGFNRYEISHIKAGRFNKISKKSLQLYKKLTNPKKNTRNKPIIIDNGVIKLKPFLKLKPMR